MTARRETDAIVIGAGIIGVAIAFELGKRGLKTLNVDRLPASGYGPTSNSCAIVRGHYSSRDGVAMAHESFFSWKNWERYVGVTDEVGMARYVDTGVVLIKSQNRHYAKALKQYRALGLAYEDWTPEQLRSRFPLYTTRSFWPPKLPSDPTFWNGSAGEIEGAIFTPGGGFVIDPLLATHNLQRAVESQGGEFLFKSEVVGIRSDCGHVRGAQLSDGSELSAEIVVNVAGPHSFLINRMAGVERDMKVKTRALRHEVHHVPAPADFDFEADGVMTSDPDLGIYFRPSAGNNILVGSEDPACDTRQWIDDPNTYNRRVTEAQWEAQVYRLAHRIPSLRIPTQRAGVVDLYDVSDDWIPIYDKSSLPGFYMAVGTSGNQFKNAPIVGHLMAELITQVEGGHDHDAEPVRFTTQFTKLELSAGFYSRLRDINPESSFSVAG